MVNNAGVSTDLHAIVDETEEQYGFFTMAVNANGVWLGCKLAITQMLEQEDLSGGESSLRGKIVNIRPHRGARGAGCRACLLRLEGCRGEPYPPTRGRLRAPEDQRQRDLPGFPRRRDGAPVPRRPGAEQDPARSLALAAPRFRRGRGQANPLPGLRRRRDGDRICAGLGRVLHGGAALRALQGAGQAKRRWLRRSSVERQRNRNVATKRGVQA